MDTVAESASISRLFWPAKPRIIPDRRNLPSELLPPDVTAPRNARGHIDPWHSFAGVTLTPARVSAVRPRAACARPDFQIQIRTTS